jgi:hypothetical protein
MTAPRRLLVAVTAASAVFLGGTLPAHAAVKSAPFNAAGCGPGGHLDRGNGWVWAWPNCPFRTKLTLEMWYGSSVIRTYNFDLAAGNHVQFTWLDGFGVRAVLKNQAGTQIGTGSNK